MKKSSLSLAVVVGAILASASITAVAAATPAEVTPDGLHLVESPALALMWKRPDVDYKRYTKIMFIPDGITFKPVTRRDGNAFPISEDQQEKLNKLLLEVFTDELGKTKRFTLTDKPGRDVLVVRGAMLDVVSRIPPEKIGRGATFLRDIGEATLVVELQDSATGEFLARGADRRAAASPWPRKSNPVTNTSEIRNVARQWASELRRRLDEL